MRRLTAVLLATPLLLASAGTAAHADPSQTISGGSSVELGTVGKKHHANFTGTMAPNKKSGTTEDNPNTTVLEGGTCNEAVTSGATTGTFTCTVTWIITTGKTICQVPDGAYAGTADYTSNSTGPKTVGSIKLYGVGAAGGGVLAGSGFTDFVPQGVLHITIDASDACGATAALDGAGIGDGGLDLGKKLEKFSGTADYT